MSDRNTVYDDDKKFALMKLKRNMRDVLKPHQLEDSFLARWLGARSWNVDAAEEMLRQVGTSKRILRKMAMKLVLVVFKKNQSLKWRTQWEVDGALKDWIQPEVVQLYYPYGISGVDNDGCPVIIIRFAELDVFGLLHSASRQDLIRSTIQILENIMQMAADNGKSTIIVICDMEDFSLKQYTWRPAAEYVISLLQTYEANYPEILKACYIINAPSVFAIAFTIVKRFLNEYTISKIRIFKKDPKKWKAILLSNISPDQLPRHYGGSLVDPDGDERYRTKINQGGKVPETYYIKKVDQIENETHQHQHEYVTTVIKKGDKLTLDFTVTDDDCFLRWDFRTEEHDIRFGITLKDATGNTTPAIRYSRVSSHQIDEKGVLACQAPATYTVTFDNSYSVMRNKKIHYCIYLTPPLKKIDILPTEEVVTILEAAKIDLDQEVNDADYSTDF